jgi:hypothetical protein
VRTPAANGTCPSGYTKSEVLSAPGIQPPPELGYTVSFPLGRLTLPEPVVSTFALPVSGALDSGNSLSFPQAGQVVPVDTTFTKLVLRVNVRPDSAASASAFAVSALLQRSPVGSNAFQATPLQCEASATKAQVLAAGNDGIEVACTATGSVTVLAGERLFYTYEVEKVGAADPFDGRVLTSIGLA